MRLAAAGSEIVARLGLSPLDRLTLAYAAFAIITFLVLWPAGYLPGPAPMMMLHATLASLALLGPRARRSGRLGTFVGEFYPLLLTTALYLAVGSLNRARGISYDNLLQQWEQTLFGGQPSLSWIRSQPFPALSSVLHAGYLSFYVIVASAVFLPWFTGRRGEARETALLTMRAFYCCWAISMLFPVAGPRHMYPPADNAATRTALAVLTHSIVDGTGAAAWGTAFPSSHVAASLVAAGSAVLRWTNLGAVLLPLAVLLALGTVYGQFHYALDALAGVAVGVIVLALRRRSRNAARTDLRDVAAASSSTLRPRRQAGLPTADSAEKPRAIMRHAIVIGSGSGIGGALVKLLGQSGYAVGLAGRRIDLMKQIQIEIPTPTYLRAVDLSQPSEARRELAALIAEMDGVDLIVINAGVGHPDPDWEEQLNLLRVNVIGFAAAAELAMDYFIARGSGHLVGVSSVQAVRGLTTAYSASKAFASTYLEAQRLRATWLGSDVCVTEVRPGFVESAMTAGQDGLFWMVSADEAARQIFGAIEHRKRVVYIPKRWQIVAGLLRLAPYRVLASLGKRWSPPLRRPPDAH